MNRLFLAALVLLSAGSAQAYELKDKLVQGALVRGQAAPGSAVALDGEALMVAKDGRFVFGLKRDAPSGMKLTIQEPGKPGLTDTLAVEQRSYQISRVDGLPPAKVEPDPKALEQIKEDNRRINEARARRSDETGAFQAFQWPFTGRISDVYGSQRVLNGQPRSPHLGIDIAAPEGTPIHAPAAGVVSLVAPGMFFNGNAVMLDHGQGVASIYAHMSEILVKPGQHVAQGEVIGKVGMTGRATGPHSHWGLFWKNVGLDPMLVLPPMPAAPRS